MRLILVFFTVLALFTLSSGDARAQTPQVMGEIVQEPICFSVRSEAQHKVFGRIATEKYIRPDGIKTRHRFNFRLDPAGSLDENGQPTDRAEFCSYGPFFEGRKLDLTLRTLVPIFSCKTRIDQGEIIITGERNAEGSLVTKAHCFE